MSQNKRKWLLIIYAVNLASFAIPLFFMTRWFLELYGLIPDDSALIVPQMLGGVALGNMVMSLLIAQADFQETQRPFFINQTVAWAGTLFAGLTATLTGAMNIMGWMFVINPIIWIVLFGYLSFGQQSSQSLAVK